MTQAAIAVGGAAAQFLPCTAGLSYLKDHRDRCGGAANRDIQHMCCDLAHCWLIDYSLLAHDARSFSRRRRVILRCSWAAIRRSVSGSFERRTRALSRISSAVLPVAQIRNTTPNFA